MLTVTVEIDPATAALGRIPQEIVDAVAEKVRKLTTDLQHHIVADKLQGQVLQHRSGALSRSIQQDVETVGETTTGIVFSSGDVKYAAIHEYGGTTKPHDIFPVKAQALAFMMGGNQVFAKVVHHPGSKIPQRSFMRTGLADMAQQIVDELRAAAVQGAHKAMGR